MEHGELAKYAAILNDNGEALIEVIQKSMKEIENTAFSPLIALELYVFAKNLHLEIKEVLDEIAGLSDMYDEFALPYALYLRVYGASVERLALLRQSFDLSDN